MAGYGHVTATVYTKYHLKSFSHGNIVIVPSAIFNHHYYSWPTQIQIIDGAQFLILHPNQHTLTFTPIARENQEKQRNETIKKKRLYDSSEASRFTGIHTHTQAEKSKN